MTSQEGSSGKSGPASMGVGWPWLLWMVCLTTYMPYVVVSVFIAGTEVHVLSLVPTFAFGLALAIVTGALVIRTQDIRAAIVTAVVGTLVYLVTGWSLDGWHSGQLMFPIFDVAVLYRIVRLFRTSSLTEENRKSLIVDSTLIAVSVLILLLNRLQGDVMDWFTLLMGLGLVLRIACMWQIERITDASRDARGSTPILIALVAFIVLFGQKLLYGLLVAVVAVGAVISVPFLYLLSKVFPSKLFTRGWEKLSKSSKPGSKTLLAGQGPIHPSPFLHWLLLVVYVTVVLLAVWFIGRRVKRVLGNEEVRKGASSEVFVERHFLRGEDRLRLIPTTHPVRKKYQEWLQGREKAGVLAKGRETPREFERRVFAEPDERTNLEDNEPMQRQAQALREHYERVRYGEED